jgi:hypothetical protein
VSTSIDITPQTHHDKRQDILSKSLPEPLSNQWLATRTQISAIQFSRHNIIASSAVAASTAAVGGLQGMKWRSALALGGIAGAVTLAFTSNNFSP